MLYRSSLNLSKTLLWYSGPRTCCIFFNFGESAGLIGIHSCLLHQLQGKTFLHSIPASSDSNIFWIHVHFCLRSHDSPGATGLVLVLDRNVDGSVTSIVFLWIREIIPRQIILSTSCPLDELSSTSCPLDELV